MHSRRSKKREERNGKRASCLQLTSCSCGEATRSVSSVQWHRLSDPVCVWQGLFTLQRIEFVIGFVGTSGDDKVLQFLNSSILTQFGLMPSMQMRDRVVQSLHQQDSSLDVVKKILKGHISCVTVALTTASQSMRSKSTIPSDTRHSRRRDALVLARCANVLSGVGSNSVTAVSLERQPLFRVAEFECRCELQFTEMCSERQPAHDWSWSWSWSSTRVRRPETTNHRQTKPQIK